MSLPIAASRVRSRPVFVRALALAFLCVLALVLGRLALAQELTPIANPALLQQQQQTGSETVPAATGGPIRLRQPAGAAAVPQVAASAPSSAALPAQPSAFETYTKLARFGADMVAELAGGATDFSPTIPPDYVIQPGDELIVTFWGSVDAEIRATVDRSGRIAIPRVGPVMVAGQQYADLPQLVAARANQVFRNFQVSVSLARLRGVRVYVTGFVQRPGAYVLSSLSTAMNAVMRAGGPAASGSYRQIELRRAGKVAARLDLYDLLVRGDRSNDKLLQPDDVIQVNAVGPLVGVTGSVNRQAIYELRPGETLGDALRMAGNFNAVADRTRVALDRVEYRNQQRIVEIKLPAGLGEPLVDGDIVRAFSAVDASLSVLRQNKRVRVDGEVGRPGEYLMPPDATIADAVRIAGGLTPAAYLFGAQFARESVRVTQQENYDRALRDLETDMVRASATARVANPEEAAAASASATANQRLLERLRALKPTGRIAFQLPPDAKELPNLVLEDGDSLYIPPRPNTVGVFGSVFSSGSYLYSTDRSVSDYLRMAGGPTRGADQTSVFMVRANGTVESSLQHGGGGLFSRSLAIGDLPVEPGDTIFVPEEMNKVTWTSFAKDWTTILFNFGLGAAGLKQALGW